MDKKLYITQDGKELIADLRGAQRALLKTLRFFVDGLTVYELVEETKYNEHEYRNIDNKVLTDAIANLVKADCVEYK